MGVGTIRVVVGTGVRLEKWADRSLVKFNKEKCKVLPLERNKPGHQRQLGATRLERRFAEKAGGVLVSTKLTTSQRCALVAKAAMVSWVALGGGR